MDAEKLKQRRRTPILVDIFAIFIVFFLAVLFSPSSSLHNYRLARIAVAKTEIMNLMAAISQYRIEYNGFPISSNLSNSSCCTYGTFNTADAEFGITNSSGPQANNSELMAIIMDLDKFPDGKPTINANHRFNPKNIITYNPKMSSDTNSYGLGTDYVLRDPWGHPYIITINFHSANRCRDAFYKLASVSENGTGTNGLLGLVRPTPPHYNSPELRDSFELPNASLMIWSLGPDGKADKNQKADQGINKDNIVSWR